MVLQPNWSASSHDEADRYDAASCVARPLSAKGQCRHVLRGVLNGRPKFGLEKARPSCALVGESPAGKGTIRLLPKNSGE
eukprot:scaffold2114_cov253-Pinguiococcus_pyrenoidosus.AAC.23